MESLTLNTRKGYTKTHTVKIDKKAFITFEDYKGLLVGKRDKTYFGTIDLIEDVYKDNFGLINYLVKEEKTGEKRTHGTFIHPKEVF